MLSQPSHLRKALAIIVALGLALRLALALFFPGLLASDALDYHNLAISLAQGNGYTTPWNTPETVRAPGYAAFVSGFYALLGPRQVFPLIGHAVLDMATVLLLWWWARRRLGEGVAIVAAAAWAFSLSAIGATRNLFSETLAAFLLTLALVLFDSWWSSQGEESQGDGPAAPRRSWRLMVGVGFVFGLLTLVRAMMIGLPIAFAILAFCKRPPAAAGQELQGRRPVRWRRGVLVPLACMLVAYALTLAPWLARNERIIGKPVFSTQSGWLLWSYHKPWPGVKYGDSVFNDDLWRQTRAMNPVEGESLYRQRTLESIRRDPKPVLAYLPKKVFFYFVPFDWEFWRTRIFNPTYLLTMLAACYGALSLRRSHPHLLLVTLLPLFYGLLIALPFFGSPRYRFPNEAPLCLVAAWGVLQVLGARRGKRIGQQIGGAAIEKRDG